MPKKKIGSVHTAKNGAKYRITKDGRARWISGPTKGPGSKKKKTGGSVSISAPSPSAVGGGVRMAGGLKRKKRRRK